MGKKSKKPSHAALPSQTKAPRNIEQPSGKKRPRSYGDSAVDDEQPVWLFQWVDNDGPWAWKNVASDLVDVCDRLGSYESMTWREIMGRQSHAIDVSELPGTSKAKVVKRLKEIGKEYLDSLFSLRINGPGRVWGHRAGNALFILWWDPEHTVYKQTK